MTTSKKPGKGVPRNFCPACGAKIRDVQGQWVCKGCAKATIACVCNQGLTLTETKPSEKTKLGRAAKFYQVNETKMAEAALPLAQEILRLKKEHNDQNKRLFEIIEKDWWPNTTFQQIRKSEVLAALSPHGDSK